MSLKSIPNNMETARACLVCSLIKNFEQFESDGCDNCDSFLQMKNNRDNVYECTSPHFEGMIALMSPNDSWVAKWQNIDNFTKGIYAHVVYGRLPSKFVKTMRDYGIRYQRRDKESKRNRRFENN